MFTYIQSIAPQHALSRFAGFMANCEIPWVKNRLIQYFVNRYPVKLEEAIESNPYAYSSFNDFFLRRLKPEVRPIANGINDFVSPADGCISQIGTISQGQILQAKGHHFSVSDLLAGQDNLSQAFLDGSFITIYLAPQDYHRVHMPIDGRLTEMHYVPGKLFSVNAKTAETKPNLFAENERVITVFSTNIGRVAIVLVGAMIVGSIDTVWAGTVTPSPYGTLKTWHYDHPINLKRGEEMGRFKLGSTVIILTEKNTLQWNPDLVPLQHVQYGQCIGKLSP